MNIFTLLFEGLALGLTTGTLCLATCAPVYIPVILQKEQGMKSATWTVFQLSLGRFISYAGFGAISGAMGAAITGFIDLDNIIIGSYIVVALYLIYSAIIQGRKEKGFCPAKKYSKYAGSAFLLGLITGITLCPAFFGAFTRALDTGGAAGGAMLFIGFFAGTTLYFLPFGFLSYLTKKKVFRTIGIFASFLIAFWFLYKAGDKIWEKHNSFIFNYTEEEIYLLNSSENLAVAGSAIGKFKLIKTVNINVENLTTSLESMPENSKVILITDSIPSPELAETVKNANIYLAWSLVNKETKDINYIYNFLKSYYLKARKSRGFFYKIPAVDKSS